MIEIYHNPRCSKSRAGMKFIEDNKIDTKVVEYLKEPLTADEIKLLVSKTGLSVTDLVRTHEEYYKQNLKGKEYSDEEWYVIIAEHPNLLHRPIVVNGDKAVWAQPPEKMNEIL